MTLSELEEIDFKFHEPLDKAEMFDLMYENFQELCDLAKLALQHRVDPQTTTDGAISTRDATPRGN
jgi:hypothetical protein